MGVVEKAIEYGITAARRLQTIRARPRIVYIHAQAHFRGVLPVNPMRWQGSEILFYPNKTFKTIQDWHDYQAAIPELTQLQKDFQKELEKNWARLFAAFIVLIGAAVKKFIDVLAEMGDEYNQFVKEVEQMEKDINQSDEEQEAKQEALAELKAKRATWSEWFSGSKAAEEQALEEQLKASAEEVEKIKGALLVKRKMLEAAEARMIEYNDPIWNVD